jgi:ABC-2 type transport system ATP-binding protein
MSETILQFDHVSFSATKKLILNELSLSLSAGKTLAVIGHNGAGKTTLFHLVLGLKFPTQGSIKLFGRPSENPDARLKVGYVAERPYLNTNLTLVETLNYFGALAKLSTEEIKARQLTVIPLVGLENAKDRKLKDYSKGMLQRSLIAQALIASPDLLILDEPMSGLDPEGRTFVKELILKLKNDGKSILFSTHTLEDVSVLADDVVVLNQGNVKFQGSISEWSTQQ